MTDILNSQDSLICIFIVIVTVIIICVFIKIHMAYIKTLLLIYIIYINRVV